MKNPKGPSPKEGLTAIRVSAQEFAGLLERVTTTPYLDAEYHAFTIFPVVFWVPRDEWQQHNLKLILHNCASKWKDVLTEPTMVKLRALLDASPSAQVAQGATMREAMSP